MSPEWFVMRRQNFLSTTKSFFNVYQLCFYLYVLPLLPAHKFCNPEFLHFLGDFVLKPLVGIWWGQGCYSTPGRDCIPDRSYLYDSLAKLFRRAFFARTEHTYPHKNNFYISILSAEGLSYVPSRYFICTPGQAFYYALLLSNKR